MNWMEDNITEWGEIFHAYAEQIHITLWVKWGGMGAPPRSHSGGSAVYIFRYSMAYSAHL